MNRFQTVLSNRSRCNYEPIYEPIFIYEPFEEKSVHKHLSLVQKDYKKRKVHKKVHNYEPFSKKGS